ncbi:hypothetical protein KY284_034139 [Solanum tuberosum]|nr:hypothetical protein KY284_034139 [Solanum tuberosum]
MQSKEGKIAKLIEDMEIARLMIHVQQVEEDQLKDREEFWNKKDTTGNEFGQQKSNANRLSFKHKQKGPAPSSASAHQETENFRARPAHSQGSVAQGGNGTSAYAKCGRNHSGVCRDGSTGCFKCGHEGHFMKEFPKNRQGDGNRGTRSQFSLVAPLDRAAPRGAISGTGGGENHPGASLSFVTTYVAMNFNILPEQLLEPFSVFTPVGESILGMDWLHSCYASIDCRTRVVKFQFPNEPIIEWISSSTVPKGHFISYLKDMKLVSKGCIYHFVRVNDSSVETPPIQSVPIVS